LWDFLISCHIVFNRIVLYLLPSFSLIFHIIWPSFHPV
jgi:hypothetical protein